VQHHWFIGGPHSVRGHMTGAMHGTTMAVARAEVGRELGPFAAIIFGDAGWAGRAADFHARDGIGGIGAGIGLLGGVARLDVIRPSGSRALRVELYVDGLL
jgi:hypothetical protein